MTTNQQKIYLVKKGGQGIRQALEQGIVEIEYEIIYNSGRPEITGLFGSNSFTNEIWAIELEDLKKWAKEWASGYIQDVDDLEFTEKIN